MNRSSTESFISHSIIDLDVDAEVAFMLLSNADGTGTESSSTDCESDAEVASMSADSRGERTATNIGTLRTRA